jgi:sugar (pentulose or hexulose) kinase
MSYLLAIALGTSSVKVTLLASPSLRLKATASREYPVNQPQPGPPAAGFAAISAPWLSQHQPDLLH